MKENLFDKFFSQRDNLRIEFERFDAKYKLGLVNKLINENDERQFYSRITEINFGIFFDNIGCSVEYDKLCGKMTPDWTLKINEQYLIAEVLRLNPSELDKDVIDFEEGFEAILRKINIGIGCVLEISFDKKRIKSIDIDKCSSLVKNWLIGSPQVDDVIFLFDAVRIKIHTYNDSRNIISIFGPNKIDFDYNRLIGGNSALLKKVRKYDCMIRDNNIPYIVCLFLDTHSWFAEGDLYQYLYGLSTEHLHEKIISHFIGNALYYSPERVMDNVSGILVRRMDHYTYYHNFTSANRLCLENKKLFSKWQHPYE